MTITMDPISIVATGQCSHRSRVYGGTEMRTSTTQEPRQIIVVAWQPTRGQYTYEEGVMHAH